MASRSRSRSPLIHEFNLGIDQTIPTSSHTAIGDMSNTEDIAPGQKKYTEGKYHLRLENVPVGWQWFNVSVFIRKHTDCVDRAIAKDITHIDLKTLPSTQRECWIHFQTEHLRNQAFLLIKHTSEKVYGKKIFAYKYGALTDWTPKAESTISNTGSKTSTKAKSVDGQYHLKLDNVPVDWKWLDVSNYIKKHTDCVNKDFADDINCFELNNYSNSFQGTFIRFKTEYYRDRVFELLKNSKEKVNGKKLYVNKVKDKAHHESNQRNDGASNTPSHTSVPINSDTFVKKCKKLKSTEGKYILRLENLPAQWKWNYVSKYIEKYTNKATVQDIRYIRIHYEKSGNVHTKTSLVPFMTEHFREQAYQALKIRERERIKGKKIFVYKVKDTESSLDYGSNMPIDGASPTPSHTSNVSQTSDTSAKTLKNTKPMTGGYHLLLSNVPLDWKSQDVSDYVKRQTNCVDKSITEHISCIKISKGPNLLQANICFTAEYIRELAYEILKCSKERVYGKTLLVLKVQAPRDRSRSPLHRETNPSNDRASPTPLHSSAVSTYDLPEAPRSNCGENLLRLDNVPCDWKRFEVTNYIRRHTDCVDKAIAKDIAFIQIKMFLKLNLQEYNSHIYFKTEQYRNQAFELLQQTKEKVNGNKLNAFKAPFTKKISAFKDITSLTDEEDETYGLSVDFLKEHNIPLPLNRKVFVKFLPLDCEESKAHIIFSCAGIIDSLSLQKTDNYSTAIVEYEHPVEAVQAVSMFNKQEIFGREISCNMIKYQTDVIKGFSSLGPGLGPNGTPLKDIRLTIELKKLKTDIIAEYNTVLESAKELEAQINSIIQANDTTLAYTDLQTKPNVINPITTLRNLLANQYRSVLQTTQSNTGTDSGALETLLSNIARSNMDMQAQAITNQSGLLEPIQVDTDIQSGPNPDVQVSPNQNNTYIKDATNMQGNTQKGFNMQKNSNTPPGSGTVTSKQMQSGFQMANNQSPFQGYNINSAQSQQGNMQSVSQNTDNMVSSENKEHKSTVLQFKNLPPSLTQPALKTKMLEVGNVKFVQLGNGRALVHFLLARDADECYRLFNQTKLDGQLIEVRKI